jgi:hypothetical protein
MAAVVEGLLTSALARSAVAAQGGGAPSVDDYYKVFAANAFLLLGLWWTVVQLKVKEGAGDPVRRRHAYATAMFFLLPGVMALVATINPGQPLIWRIAFAGVGVLGIAEILLYLAGGAPHSRWPNVLRVIGTVTYLLVLVVAILPTTTRYAGMAAKEVEALLLGVLLVIGIHLFWFGVTAPDPVSRFDDTAEHEAYLTGRLRTDDDTYVVLSLVPDLDGHLDVDTTTFREFQSTLSGANPLILGNSMRWSRFSVSAGRLIADGARDRSWRLAGMACALHRSGAGACAVPVAPLQPQGTSINDEHLVNAAMSALRLLAQHARQRAAVSGRVALRATIVPITDDPPTRLIHGRNLGRASELGGVRPTTSPVATGVADVNGLARGGPRLVAATHVLVSELVQDFGCPEVLQVSRDGAIRGQHWDSTNSTAVRAWAEASGVEVSG